MRKLLLCLIPLLAVLLLWRTWGFWGWNDRAEVFRAAIAEADEIRITGLGLWGHRDGRQEIVMCRFTDPQALREVRERLAFEKRPEPRCKCIGYPHVHWFQGGERIVSVSLHHGKSLRWGGWERGDSAFTPETRMWLMAWLEER